MTGNDHEGTQDGIEESDLQAFLDGALDPSREAVVRAWLEAHPDALDRLSRYAEQQLAVITAQSLPDRPRLPAPLVRDLERGLERGLRRDRFRERAGRVAATILLVAVGWGANDLLRQPVFASLPMYAQEAVDAHEVFANDPSRPVEIPGNRPEEIRRWLTAKLGETVTIPQLHRLGLHLVGARVLGGEGGPTGQLLYEDDLGRRMTLLLAPDEALGPDQPVLSDYDGLEVGYWRGVDFALVAISSELPMELDRLADAIDVALQAGVQKNPL